MIINSCESDQAISAEASRFESALRTSKMDDMSTCTYIIWNENGCPSCKIKSIIFVNKHPQKNIKIIIPISDKKLIHQLDSSHFILDKFREFGKFYYGISNVGTISTSNGHVTQIKNYIVGDMNLLEKDLNLLKN